jgi:hypothetical protein
LETHCIAKVSPADRVVSLPVWALAVIGVIGFVVGIFLVILGIFVFRKIRAYCRRNQTRRFFRIFFRNSQGEREASAHIDIPNAYFSLSTPPESPSEQGFENIPLNRTSSQKSFDTFAGADGSRASTSLVNPSASIAILPTAPPEPKPTYFSV